MYIATMAWTHNGGHVPTNSHLKRPSPGVTVLTLSAVQEENVGIYACLAHSHAGMYRSAISLELDIYGEIYAEYTYIHTRALPNYVSCPLLCQ